MSWGFTFVAESKDAAKKEIDRIVAQNSGLTSEVGGMINHAIDALPEPMQDRTILVDSNGHIDQHQTASYGTSGGNLKFQATLIGKVKTS